MPKLFGVRQVPSGAEAYEPLQARKKGTKELGNILKLEEGEVPDREAEGSKIEGGKRIFTRKERNILGASFEDGGFMARKELWNIAKKQMLEDRGAVSKEEGNFVRERNARHEEHFPSSWVREDEEGEVEEVEEKVQGRRDNEWERSRRIDVCVQISVFV